MTNEVEVSYRKRMITVTERDHEGSDKILIELVGYPLMYAKDRAEMEQRLEEIYEHERVRLSYKKG